MLALGSIDTERKLHEVALFIRECLLHISGHFHLMFLNDVLDASEPAPSSALVTRLG